MIFKLFAGFFALFSLGNIALAYRCSPEWPCAAGPLGVFLIWGIGGFIIAALLLLLAWETSKPLPETYSDKAWREYLEKAIRDAK